MVQKNRPSKLNAFCDTKTSKIHYQYGSCVELCQFVRDHRVTDKRHYVGLTVPKHASRIVHGGVHGFNGFR